MRHSKLHHGIDVLWFRNSLHDAVDRLIYHRHEDTIRDETREVIHFNWSLADFLRKFFHDGIYLVGRCNTANDLDKLHYWHRIEEVHPDDL